MTAPTMIDDALAAAARLREDADFNRSWTDGRRGQPHDTPAYKARRIEVAEERERWAEAIKTLVGREANSAPVMLMASYLPERFMDEIDAAHVANTWIERLETPRINADGSAYLLWHNERLVAATWLVRDGMNFTVLVKWQAPAAEQPTQPTAEMLEAAPRAVRSVITTDAVDG